METITTTKSLNDLIDKIRSLKVKYVTIDTEFVREKTYYPTLGLIQIAYRGGESLIDPVDNNMDMKALNDLFQDKNIVKVFHACGQDLEIFYNIFEQLPVNLFDTQVAAKMLGFGEAASYSRLVEDLLKISLDKSQRYTDWMRRPLDNEQKEYAIADVTHLRDVYEILVTKLTEQKRLKWAEEEMEKLLDVNLYKVDADEAWRKQKVKSHDKKYLACLKAISRWREVKAQTQNRPRPWVLKDDGVQEIASLRPTTVDQMRDLRFFRFDAKMATEIAAVIEWALENEKAPAFEKEIKIPEAISPLMDLLRIILRTQGYKHDIAPSVIADSDDLKYIALKEFKKTQAMKGWRYEVFGHLAERLMKGRLAIAYDKGKLIYFEPKK